MKKILLINALFCFSVGIVCAQTTATDFTTDDCNGVTHNLFNDLDAGNVIVIGWVMPCGPCATYTIPAYSAVQSFATSHPGRVHFYLVDDYANTTCATLINWGNTNNMPLNTTFSSADIDMYDYGTAGMPKVAVLGGIDHTVYYNTNNSQINFNGVQTAITNALSAPLAVEQSVNNEFEILSYPNPVNNVLNVSYTNIKSAIINFTIVDVLGKVVLSIEEDASYLKGEATKSINISALNNGNYFLKISSAGIVESIPFIVSH
jgi:hypothetical protein